MVPILFFLSFYFEAEASPPKKVSYNQLPYYLYIWDVQGNGDETVAMQTVTLCSLLGRYWLSGGFFWRGGTAAQLIVKVSVTTQLDSGEQVISSLQRPLTTQQTHEMNVHPSAGFRLLIPATGWPQTYASDCTATSIIEVINWCIQYWYKQLNQARDTGLLITETLKAGKCLISCQSGTKPKWILGHILQVYLSYFQSCT